MLTTQVLNVIAVYSMAYLEQIIHAIVTQSTFHFKLPFFTITSSNSNYTWFTHQIQRPNSLTSHSTPFLTIYFPPTIFNLQWIIYWKNTYILHLNSLQNIIINNKTVTSSISIFFSSKSSPRVPRVVTKQRVEGNIKGNIGNPEELPCRWIFNLVVRCKLAEVHAALAGFVYRNPRRSSTCNSKRMDKR